MESAAKKFRKSAPPKLLVVIGGGGEIGFNLARVLSKGRFGVVLMEGDRDRCETLAAKLDGVTVLHGDVTRRSEMEEARVGKAGVFVAATGRDEDNIVCGVEARELGAKRIMSVVRRPDYANVLGKLGIDVAVSPRNVMSRQVDGMVQTGAVLARFDVAGKQAAVYEVEVRAGCELIGVPLKDAGFHRSLVGGDRPERLRAGPGGGGLSEERRRGGRAGPGGRGGGGVAAVRGDELTTNERPPPKPDACVRLRRGAGRTDARLPLRALHLRGRSEGRGRPAVRRGSRDAPGPGGGRGAD